MLEQGYGIMPNVILFHKNLSDKQKLLFCLISSLCAERGYCRATNEYLGGLLGVNQTTISTNLGILQLAGFIEIEIDKEKGNKRQIALLKNQNSSFEKSKEGSFEKSKEGGVCETEVQQQVKPAKPKPNSIIYNNIKENNNTKVLLQQSCDSLTPLGDGEEVKKYGNEEINGLIELIKQYNNGIVDGTIKEQRQYGKLLFVKLQTVGSGISQVKNPKEILEVILKIISSDEFHSHKIVGPKKIYYELAGLMQICKQRVVKGNKNNIKSF